MLTGGTLLIVDAIKKKANFKKIKINTDQPTSPFPFFGKILTGYFEIVQIV